MPYGKSIHIGLNFVDPDAYGGWDGQLNGCVNDANGLQAVADSLGYESTLITDQDGTSYRVLQELSDAAEELSGGDILWISYSGHGGQVDDANSDEADAKDETWVLYDREVVDDELYAMWSQFEAGVRILVTSDSCHSGTVARMMIAEELQRARAQVGARKARGEADQEIPEAFAPSQEYRAKALPLDVQAEVNERDRAMYNTVQWLAGPSHRQVIRASVLLISGCQDNQLSYDGNFYGQFTGTLLSVWDNGSFQGDYEQFHTAIVNQMPPDQTPNYFTTGVQNRGFEGQRPFTIAPPSGTGAGASSGGSATGPEGGTSPTTPTTSRPTLRRGDRGEDVIYLQQRLNANGYSTTADGIFGSGTEEVVREFQADRGLTADGIVGESTWAALEEDPGASGGGAGPSIGDGYGDESEGSGTGSGGSGTATDRPTLSEGDRGDEVSHLQELLRDRGYTISPDGIFGPYTESIVRQFQRDNGLTADGIVGESTWAALGC